MKKKQKPRRGHRRMKAGVIAGGTATVATLGLSTCNNGTGTSVDPVPPPPLVCKDANQGQNLVATGQVNGAALQVHVSSTEYFAGIDTAFVSSVAGATLDSLEVANTTVNLAFTLDSLAVTEVTFTLAGTFNLDAGPCNFTRTFIVTINGGAVDVSQNLRELPLGPGREIRIEVAEHVGRTVRLRPVGVASGQALWSVTGGTLQSRDDGTATWELPAEPGFYQVDLYADYGDDGFGFDALSFEVVQPA